ncbi:hypothetical protein ANN_26440 [Periplaneta americana]|uniref:Uncharacterized protein n=1 Tax=Periplaneta americana TaxID=6978 RepID=A0ABQ8RY32_PERAM|nr:hypothetical protein ANN_26440 [Periplaneta americana]
MAGLCEGGNEPPGSLKAIAGISFCLRLALVSGAHFSGKLSDSAMSLVTDKKYKLATSDKFDEYMKALGVGLVTSSPKPSVELKMVMNFAYILLSRTPINLSGQEFGRKVNFVK